MRSVEHISFLKGRLVGDIKQQIDGGFPRLEADNLVLLARPPLDKSEIYYVG